MDPALQELIDPRGEPDELLEVLVRLRKPGDVPPGVAVVAAFGKVITCRIRRADIRDIYASLKLCSLKASRYYRSTGVSVAAEPQGTPAERPRRMSPDQPAGRGVVLAVLDWGFDIPHREFCRPDGTSRVIGFWHQGKPYQPERPNPYGYGRTYTAEDIAAGVASATPYAELEYHPGAGRSPRFVAHGTHVAAIAGGTYLGGAPEAELVFVHLSTADLRPDQHLGDSVRILEALDYVRRVAGERKLVVNMSLGRHGAPKDGTSLVVQAIDDFIASRGATIVCQSTGNYFLARAHHAGTVHPGKYAGFTFEVSPNDPTPNEVEVWYSGRDVFELRLSHLPSGESFQPGLGSRTDIELGGNVVGRLYHRRKDPNNGKNHIDLFLHRDAPAGRWRITLFGERVVDGNYHAYLERDSGCRNCQARFLREDVSRESTIGSLAASRHALVVGAYGRRHRAVTLGTFSSAGPTLDGRGKPDLLAPGLGILSARSTPGHRTAPEHAYVRQSGTSMAAPHVAGTCAAVLELLPPDASFYLIRRLILGGADRPPEHFAAGRSGAGILNPSRTIGLTHHHLKQHAMSAITFPATEVIPRIGRIRLQNNWISLRPANLVALVEVEGFDRALRQTLDGSSKHYLIRGNMWTDRRFTIVEIDIRQSLIFRSVIAAEWIDGPPAAVILNGRTPYFPAAEGSNRWVAMPRALTLLTYTGPELTRQRASWINRLHRIRASLTVPGVSPVNRAALTALPTPALRLLLARHARLAYPVSRVRRRVGGRRVDRGGVTHGTTGPIVRFPIHEPECYQAVIASAEGKMESINAWDYKAGISVGPIQINANRSAILRFLLELHRADPVLFSRLLGRPMAWTMTERDGHPVLTVNVGTPTEFELVGLRSGPDYQRAWRRIYGYFQSGDPARHRAADINPAFRRDLAARFARVLAWPHVQDLVSKVTDWWLQQGKDILTRAGYAPLDGSAPDPAAFELRSMLMSMYVRYSGCLSPFLRALAGRGATEADRLTHWRAALRSLASTTCRGKEGRLAAQRTQARRVLRRLNARAVPPALRGGAGEVTAPDPTLWPTFTVDPDGTIRQALRDRGLSAAQVRRFERNSGFPGLRLIAIRFGPAFTELLARLRYTPPQLRLPPHNYRNLGDFNARNSGTAVRHREELLTPRVLLAIPDHFRQMGRTLTDERLAFLAEVLGWRHAYALRELVRVSTGREWWLPPVPPFAAALPSPLPPGFRSDPVLVALASDPSVVLGTPTDFTTNFQRWRRREPGQFWRNALPAPALPAVNSAVARRTIDALWAARLARVDRSHPVPASATAEQRRRVEVRRIAALTRCTTPAALNRLMANATLGGVELAYYYPITTGNTTRRRSLRVLAALAPVVQMAFARIFALGWNDLVFQTSGSSCFRGIKGSAGIPHPRRYARARRISQHSYGLALDLNVPENPLGSRENAMSPDFVALMRRHGFTWGQTFRRSPDPHHFEFR